MEELRPMAAISIAMTAKHHNLMAARRRLQRNQNICKKMYSKSGSKEWQNTVGLDLTATEMLAFPSKSSRNLTVAV